MSGNLLTVLVGVVGVVASVICSADAYRRGKRNSMRENEELLHELAAHREGSREEKEQLLDEISAQRQILSEVVARFAEVNGDNSELESRNEIDPARDAAVGVLVRAVLGTLLNARGEVEFPRLLHEVSQAVGRPSFTDIATELIELRAEGVIDWRPAGSPVDQAQVIHVYAAPHRTRDVRAAKVA